MIFYSPPSTGGGGDTSGVFTPRVVTTNPVTASAWESLTCRTGAGLVNLPPTPTQGDEVRIYAEVAGVTLSGNGNVFVWADPGPYEMSVDEAIDVMFDGSNWIPAP